MKDDDTISQKLAALAHPARLGIVRRLVRAGPNGLPAGQLGDARGMAPNALTFHLQKLAHVGLVSSRRSGQFIMYRAQFDELLDLVDNLVGACCAESGEKCGPRCPPVDACCVDSAGSCGPGDSLIELSEAASHPSQAKEDRND